MQDRWKSRRRRGRRRRRRRIQGKQGDGMRLERVRGRVGEGLKDEEFREVDRNSSGKEFQHGGEDGDVNSSECSDTSSSSRLRVSKVEDSARSSPEYHPRACFPLLLMFFLLQDFGVLCMT
eukprot:768302-Hanusia_phi.AAC.2